ncbi:MAG: GAF and ANTAR domain-containing protein [Acidimicrobiales bacterium]
MSGTLPGPGAPQFLSELAGVLLAEQNLSDLLGIIVNLAASAIDEVDGASVSMVVHDRRRFETTNASSLVIRDIDEAQYERAEGPCVEAIRTGREVSISLPTPRWPQFSERAVRAGMRSVWSLPLTVKEQTTGALNLYSSHHEPWAGTAAPAARGLAGQAAVVLANAASLANAETTNNHLQEALESRDMIGQAKGILMARQKVSANEAFDILRRASQTSGRKLRDIAAEVVSRLERPQEPA